MLMFDTKRNRELEVQRMLTKVINHYCPAVAALREGPRGENRVHLTLVVIVVPVVDGAPQLDRAFATVTKEVSSAGMAIVLNQELDTPDVLLAFEEGRQTIYALGTLRHQEPMGAGLFCAGVHFTQMVNPGDYPGLGELTI